MIKLLKTKKHDSIEPIMVTDNNANAHCVWQNNGLYCYSKFNGVDWEYLNDYKVVDAIPTNTAVPKNGVCSDSNGNPYILWAKSNLRHIFGNLSYLYLTYWNNYKWTGIEEQILREVLYGSSLMFFNNDLYIGSLIFKNNKYLFTMSICQNNTFTQLNTCEISALSGESKVLLRMVENNIYCFWECSNNNNYWIEHVIYNIGSNSFNSTLTRKINFSNNNVPISGFDFMYLDLYSSSSSQSSESSSSLSSLSSSSLSSSSISSGSSSSSSSFSSLSSQSSISSLSSLSSSSISSVSSLSSISSLSSLSSSSISSVSSQSSQSSLSSLSSKSSLSSSSQSSVSSLSSSSSSSISSSSSWPYEVTYCSGRFSIFPRTEPNIVLDNKTGRYWTKDANIGGTMSQPTAVTYCDNLTVDGVSDWKLTNGYWGTRELASPGLLDTPANDPALPLGHPFDNVQSAHYWSDGWMDGSQYWYINAVDGSLGYAMSPIGKYVWATRITVSDVSSTSSPSSVSSSSPSSSPSSPSSDIPAPPTGLTAVTAMWDVHYADLHWNGSTHATSYEVWKNTVNNSATATKWATPGGTSAYFDCSPDVQMTNYFWVKAVSGSGTSGFSSVASCWIK